ncbi:protein ZINC INDUCED FACILITATOR-LIKE 1 isoform X5 [Sesamum indicum]|uniref:Protein ZINC INDUCED FACILITATOR-LIKE 1 isoform X5 n=1 Tax=Sesamum indicum TaxID=4182 RepID=A0A8M8US19_SESIN|nr:protein ZINC INDUCED FACILITATOR-LIKE 1 isoform X5 [Sesamum indicum]
MEDNSAAEPLIKKQGYHDNCEACKIERFKESNTGIPFKLLFFVWVVTLAAALPISSLFPFLYFMTRDFHIAKREEDISYYAGYVGSSFMFGRALTSLLWGMVADKYGRKPIIMIGTIIVVVFNTLFGLSVNYWMAISTRFLLGSLCGILGPMRAYASEICRKEHQALGMSVIGTSWGIGLVIGPAVGGFLAQPAEKYPQIFSRESLFGRFPYFLPCLVISVFALVAFIISCWLPETLHIHCEENIARNSREAPPEDNTYESIQSQEMEVSKLQSTVSQRSLFRNWPLVSAIIVYCIFQLHDMAYSEIFSLWAVSSRKLGGLSFSTSDVGEVLSVTALSIYLDREDAGSHLGFSYWSCYYNTIAVELSIYSQIIWSGSLIGAKFCILVEECTLYIHHNRPVSYSKQSCGPRTKRSCKWHIYVCYVPFQSNWPCSWGFTTLLGSRQAACRVFTSHLVLVMQVFTWFSSF